MREEETEAVAQSAAAVRALILWTHVPKYVNVDEEWHRQNGPVCCAERQLRS